MLRYVTSLYEFRVQYDEKDLQLVVTYDIASYCMVLCDTTMLYYTIPSQLYNV